MTRLDFDFHTAPRRPNAIGIVLALAGAAALAWSAYAWQAARDTAAGLDRQIAALRDVRPAVRSRPAPGTDAARATRTRIAAWLAYRWQPALDALAATRDKTVALVALDADQAKSQLRLTAESRDLEHAVAWIERLQQQPGVRRATLVQHEVRSEAGTQVVRYLVHVELGA